MADGGKHAAVTAFLSSFYGSDRRNGGGDPGEPLKTARAGGQHHAIVAAHIEQANTGMVGHTPRRPLSTIVGKGCTQRIIETTLIEEGALPPEMMDRAVQVAAFLVKYYATDGDNEVAQSQAADRPLDTITTKARFAVISITIHATTYVIVDIGLRMLKPRELARAQGLPEGYILDPIVAKMKRGKLVHERLTIAEQISAIGNSVCPPVARALVAANQPGLSEHVRIAA
jgi:DNA (cytosine-5)-methyltransferase 1